MVYGLEGVQYSRFECWSACPNGPLDENALPIDDGPKTDLMDDSSGGDGLSEGTALVVPQCLSPWS